MVKLICGKVGSGKTKRIMKLANESVKDTKGDIVYIQNNNNHMLDIKHEIRFINAMEFNFESIEEFHGFLCGIISEDYDIEKIYIDGVYKIVEIDYDNLSVLLNKLEALAEKYNIDFILTLSRDPNEVPEKFNKYII